MNREETAERIKVMQAYVEGKPVQHWEDGKWHDTSTPTWSTLYDYRIKPEPRDFEVYLFEKDDVTYITETNMQGLVGWRKIKVREVLED